MRLFRSVRALLFTLTTAVLEQAKLILEDWLKAMRSRSERWVPGDRGDNTRRSSATVERPIDCLQTMIDGFADEVMIIGPDFRVRQANTAVLKRLGRSAADIIGQPCFQVSRGSDEPCHSPWCECPLNQVLQTGQSVRVIHTRWESQTDEGYERWVEVISSPIWDSNDRVIEVIELARDVSENKRLQREILRATRELLALNSISHALNQSLDLRVTLQAVAETMLNALEAQVSWVQLSDDVSKIPTARATHGLSTEVAGNLIEAISNLGSYEQPATWASYSVVPSHDTNKCEQTLWQFAVTSLKSKGVVLGVAGVATTKRPVDQHRIQLLDAIGSQIAVAVERCKLYEELQLTQDLRGELLRQVITAQEEERKRIARELHDETGQVLTALRLNLEKLGMLPVSNMEESKAQLAQCLSLCQRADEGVDKLIFDLRPALLDDLGLVEAIKFYAQIHVKTAGIKLSLKVTGKEKRLPVEGEVALFRVAQEAITNIVKHACAKSVVIQLQFKPNQLVARFEDDGCGFEVSQTVNSHSTKRGLGLLGMRERISLVGGSLGIISKPGVGTRLKAVVPLNEGKTQR